MADSPDRLARLAETLAREWTAIRSGPSPCSGERRLADALARWARRTCGNFEVATHSVPRDRCRRRCVLITLPGGRAPGVLFMAHLDTVGLGDYGALESWATDPAALERRRPLGARWLQGRGALDMKSGLAAGAAALAELAALPLEQRAGPVALLVTPDEENASAGIRAASGWKPLVQHRWGAAISMDFVPPPPAGKAGRLYFGTVGKCLVGALLRVSPAHAAQTRRGPDVARWAAGVVERFQAHGLQDELPGPAVLRARDLKPGYDTQLPESFVIYFNVLGYPLEPLRVLRRLSADVRGAWRALSGQPLPRASVRVAQRGENRAQAGEAGWDSALAALGRRGITAPGATLFFAPPYYASRGAPAFGAPASRALRRVARTHRLLIQNCYPYISDLSYLGPPTDARWRAWRAACPVAAPPAGIGMSVPVATVGPWGRGAHGPEEAVRADYAFGRLPHILISCVQEIWRTR